MISNKTDLAKPGIDFSQTTRLAPKLPVFRNESPSMGIIVIIISVIAKTPTSEFSK
jgi:hypothetical protein